MGKKRPIRALFDEDLYWFIYSWALREHRTASEHLEHLGELAARTEGWAPRSDPEPSEHAA